MILRLSHLGAVIFAVLVITPGVVSSAKELLPAVVHQVPERHKEQYKNLKAPFGDARGASDQVLTEGKHLYEGKGTCHMCHGPRGNGDGPAALMLTPPPRRFTDCEFQKTREDGELFGAIKYGIPGSGMAGVVPGELSEEEAWKVVAYLRSFCKP